MMTVSLRTLSCVPKSLSAKLSAAPLTVKFALAVKTTAALPTASVPIVMVCVASKSLKAPTVTLPIVPSFFN